MIFEVEHTNIKKKNIVRVSSYALIVLLLMLTGYFLGVFDDLVYRFSNSQSSNAVRFALLNIIVDVAQESFFGNGIGSTREFSERIGFYNVIEMPWVSFLIEMGLFGTLLFFVVWGYVVHKGNLIHRNVEMIILVFLDLRRLN